jgi:5-formyltetrahydrofolate cyclo-ligase
MTHGDKTEVRRRMRALLAGLDEVAQRQASLRLRRAVETLAGWPEARVVAAFAALASEPDLRPWEWADSKTVLLPRVAAEDLVFHAVAAPGDLRAGAFGVREPEAARCAVRDAAEAGILLVPGLAFTADGRRLGRGRGFYDRLLAGLPAGTLKVGVCFRLQVLDDLPVEDHDQRVDLVLSEPV